MMGVFKSRLQGFAAFAVLLFACQIPVLAAAASAQQSSAASFEGTVRESTGSGISDATVCVETSSGAKESETRSNATGHFNLPVPAGGTHFVRIQKAGYRGVVQQLKTTAEPLNVVLAHADSAATRNSAGEFQFSDEPNFTVAGVTDWTAAGGHGSDVSLRTSEALAKETRRLETPNWNTKPSVASTDFASMRSRIQQELGNSDRADLRRQLGDVDEQMHDPLAAVHEYERAAQLDPSEQNYFAWATELLLHRAVSPAVEVFSKGAEKHPNSERLHVGLGAALYASGLYAQAAERVCAASDLNPKDTTPYLFIGKMVQVSAQPLSCSEEKLERFWRNHSDSATANYFYAMALWRKGDDSVKTSRADQIERLLRQSTNLDPKYAEAYLQLGILYSAHDQPIKAIDAYQQAINANPNYAEAHFRLAQAYKKASESPKARQEFQAYENIQKAEAAAVEQQRREIQQFVIVFKDKPQFAPSKGDQ